MATEIGHDVLTLVDAAKMADPNGNPAKIAEVLARRDTLARTALWLPANSPTQHDFSVRLSEPAGTWVGINEGVTKEASNVKQDTAYMGTLESMSVIDIRLLRKYKSAMRNHIRSQEDLSFVSGMTKTISTAFIYSNRLVTPRAFTGLNPRADYNALADENVITCGTAGTYSAWLVQWGADGVHFVYPVGDDGKFDGIRDDDMGKQLVYTSGTSNLPYRAMCTFFSISIGLAIHDPRCVQRLANIADTQTPAADGLWDEDYLIDAINSIPGEGESAILYVPKFLRKNLWISIKDKANVQFNPGSPMGNKGMWNSLMGVDVGLCYGCETPHTALA